MRKLLLCLFFFSSAVLLLPATVFAAGGVLPGTGTEADPYLIEDLSDFYAFSADSSYWDDYTRLDCDLDLSTAGTYNQAPIAGDTDTDLYFDGIGFSGTFDGNGHIIRNLSVNGWYHCGFFGRLTTDSEVKNLGLENISITCNGEEVGAPTGGGLTAGNYDGNIINCYLTGTITGYRLVGGLVGNNSGGSITNCYSICVVTGYQSVGGLAGNNKKRGYYGSITNCYSSGAVNGGYSVGGLVGENTVDISNCYSNSTVTGDGHVGGLAGQNNSVFKVSTGNITNCYSTGVVNCDSSISGLVGSNYGGITAGSFWDVESSGFGNPGDGYEGVTGLTTAEMITAATFIGAGWDFTDNWWINDGRDYPKLFWQPFADLNNDSHINIADLAIMSTAWLTNNGDANYNRVCELSGDATINETDLAILAQMWLEGPQWP